MEDGLEYLDCTIRDGGYRNNWSFSDEDVQRCYKSVSEAGFDYFEIGFIRQQPISGFGKWHSVSVKDVETVRSFHKGCKISAMISVDENCNFNASKTNLSGIDLARIHLRVNSVEEAKTKAKNCFRLIEECKNFGLEVTLNLASADKLDSGAIDFIVSVFGNTGLKCIYIADTFGNLNEIRTAKKIREFQTSIQSIGYSVPLGFHPHNNLGNALSKSKVAIGMGIRMLDSTILGMGRGAGNLRSEFLAMDQEDIPKKIDILPILRACELICSESHLRQSVLYAMTSKFNIHPRYEDMAKCNSLEDTYKMYQKLTEADT